MKTERLLLTIFNIWYLKI